MRWLILILLISFSSCKSIKKVKDLQQDAMLSRSMMMVQSDSVAEAEMVEELSTESTIDTTEEVIEEVTSVPTVITVNGEQQVVFTTTSLVKSKISKVEKINTDSTTSTESKVSESSDTVDKDKNSEFSKDKNVDKDSESMNLMSSLLEGLLGSWGKYVLGAIALASSLLGLWLKYKQAKNTDEGI